MVEKVLKGSPKFYLWLLFLLGVILLYDLTGHLLMSPAKEVFAELLATDSYHVPVLIVHRVCVPAHVRP